MSAQQAKPGLVDVKLALAAKYERLARVCNSRNRRARYLRHAGRYRDQAQMIGQTAPKG